VRFHIPLGLVLISAAAHAADPTPGVLPPEEFAAGWVSLFDGATDFGWHKDGPVTVKDGILRIGHPAPATARPTAEFGADFEIAMEMLGGVVVAADREVEIATTASNGKAWGLVTVRSEGGRVTVSTNDVNVTSRRGEVRPFSLRSLPTSPVTVKSIKARVTKTTPLLNGQDLAGWKRFTGNPRQELSKFEVTNAGELHVTNGPGDLQTDKAFKDFCLHLECKSNGKALNSGIFFRCLQGVYQQGYEAQIQNGFKDDDRAKPTDFGTGAIYRRVPTRRVIPNDSEWFAMTVLAVGPRLRTWVNGYPTVDWVDERPANANGRNGLKLDAGPISVQGHDPTTDLLFRNIRITEIAAPR
jgi:hypothetical protein